MARARFRIGLLTAAAAFGLTACGTVDDTVYVAPNKMDAWLADKPAGAHHLYASVLTGGERNRVLNQERAGLAAFEAGDYATAAASFDDALNRIETLYADNPRAEKARSNFTPERSKEFKGEAYERAMAFYYRGLIFLAQGDYGNARAVFQGGQLQDAFAEDQRYQSDFAVLDVLSGWASQCEGNTVLARDFYSRATQSRADIFIPAPGDRILAIADMGLSPTKIGEGEYGEVLTYLEPDHVPEASVTFMAAGVPYRANFGEDLYWQATTRGGRQVDKILAGKAQFKDGATVVGAVSLQLADVALDVASWNAWNDKDHYDRRHHGHDDSDDDDSDDALLWAAGLAVVGIGALLVADSTAPEADTRYWDNLPAHIDYTTMLPDAHPTEAAFHDASGSLLGTQSTRIHLDPKGHCGLVYVKSRRAAEIPAAPPNASLER
jgi:tetratricopeptide (TPR) repeat protein